jgi:ubiquinone/menaquinone biosynthesis C-methylase UbiE
MPGSANASTAFRPNFAAVSTFGEAAPRYDGSGAQLAGPIADRLVSLAGLRPGDQVLDAGCGAGAVTVRSAPAVSPGGRVIGVDLADAMLRRTAAEAAGLGLDNVGVQRGDASRPPFARRPPGGHTGPSAAGRAAHGPGTHEAAGR